MIRNYRSYTETELRAESGGRKISGYPVVFNHRSVLMPDWEHGTAVEVIDPGAITEDTIRRSDIVCCINHDENQILARSVNGNGSLSLGIDERGVSMSFDAPDTPYGAIAYHGAERGDFRGMSFGFWLDPDNDVEYEETRGTDGKRLYVRHIRHVQGMFDVSIVTHPAYPDTDVQARSLEGFRRAFVREEGAWRTMGYGRGTMPAYPFVQNAEGEAVREVTADMHKEILEAVDRNLSKTGIVTGG